jgi:putative oxidoreductase
MIDMQNSTLLLGRLLLAALFVPAGIAKLTGYSGTVGYIASVGLPFPELAAVLAAAVEIGAGLALVVGLQTRAAALALAGFTIGASVFFHDYWAMPADQQMMQQLLFNKNVAIVGGLLVLAAAGAGAWGLDARRAPAIGHRARTA